MPMTEAEKAARQLADLRRRVEMVARTLASMEERPDPETDPLTVETMRLHLRMAVGEIKDYAKALQRAAS